jgi:hypothetical protein
MAVRVVERLERIGVHQQQRQFGAFRRQPFPRGGDALVEAAAVGDAGQAVAHRQQFELAVGGFEFGDHARKMDGAGDLRRDRIEHRARLRVEEIRPRAFDVEHAVQALAMADGHQVLGAHGGVARHVVRIAVDIVDQLGLAGPRAAAGGANAHGPAVREFRWIQIQVACPDFLDEVRAVVVEQDDAGDGDRQVAHQAFDDAAQDLPGGLRPAGLRGRLRPAVP